MLALVICKDLFFATAAITCCVLCRNDHLISVAASSHPFTNPSLGFLVLIIVTRVDKVPSVVEEVVHDLEGSFLGAFAHTRFPGDWVSSAGKGNNKVNCQKQNTNLPGLSKVHCTQTKWRDSDTSRRCQNSVVAKAVFGWWKWIECHF